MLLNYGIFVPIAKLRLISNKIHFKKAFLGKIFFITCKNKEI